MIKGAQLMYAEDGMKMTRSERFRMRGVSLSRNKSDDRSDRF